MSVSDERNNPGIRKGYRNRIIRRALAVAEDSAFRARIREARQAWHDDFPSLRIHTFETVAEWEQAEATVEVIEGWDIALLPQGSRAYYMSSRAHGSPILPLAWINAVNAICHQFWPDRFFPKQMNWDLRGNLTHPAYKFVEACMYCEVTAVAAEVERWIPEFRIHLHFLPYVPTLGDRWDLECIRGEREYWKRFALGLMKQAAKQDLPPELEKNMDERARDAGRQYAKERGVDFLDDLHKPDEEMFWFLPVSSQMSTTDVESVTPDIVRKSRQITGANFLDQLVWDLKGEGHTNESIASLLGVSLDFVKQANRRRRGVGESSGEN